MHRRFHAVPLLALAACSLFFVAARCVEHDRVVRDKDGNLHVTGELFNETDIQGAGMVVRGTIFDGDGNVIASATTPTCPRQLSPGDPVAYDIKFPDTQGAPEPASHKIEVVDGRALDTPFPELGLTVNFDINPGSQGTGYTVGMKLNRPGPGPVLYACIGIYDLAGNLTALLQPPFPAFGGTTLEQSLSIPFADYPEAAAIRLWLFSKDASGAPQPVQAYVSPIMPFALTVGATPNVPGPIRR